MRARKAQVQTVALCRLLPAPAQLMVALCRLLPALVQLRAVISVSEPVLAHNLAGMCR